MVHRQGVLIIVKCPAKRENSFSQLIPYLEGKQAILTKGLNCEK